MLRVGPAIALSGIARSFGVDPAPAFAAAGLEESLFDNSENRISIVRLGKFAAAIARLIGRPDLGLLVARTHGPHSLGLVQVLAEEGPDVRTALQNIARLLKHHSELARLSLSETESDAILSYELREPEFEESDIVLVTAIGDAFRVMRRFCGEMWCPARGTPRVGEAEVSCSLRSVLQSTGAIRETDGRPGVSAPPARASRGAVIAACRSAVAITMNLGLDGSCPPPDRHAGKQQRH